MKNAHSAAVEIELAWAEELATRFGVSVDAVSQKVRPWFDFPGDEICVELMDGSKLTLRWAFYLVSESQRAIALFTEHCGHFVVPHHEARIYINGQLVYDQRAARLGC